MMDYRDFSNIPHRLYNVGRYLNSPSFSQSAFPSFKDALAPSINLFVDDQKHVIGLTVPVTDLPDCQELNDCNILQNSPLGNVAKLLPLIFSHGEEVANIDGVLPLYGATGDCPPKGFFISGKVLDKLPVNELFSKTLCEELKIGNVKQVKKQHSVPSDNAPKQIQRSCAVSEDRALSEFASHFVKAVTSEGETIGVLMDEAAYDKYIRPNMGRRSIKTNDVAEGFRQISTNPDSDRIRRMTFGNNSPSMIYLSSSDFSHFGGFDIPELNEE